MNGFVTRQRLTEIANNKWREIEAEHTCSAFLPNAHGLGTPMGEERIKAIRRDRRYDRAFRIGGLVVILGVFAMIGASVSDQRDTVDSQINYREKAARLVAGKMSCELDQHEGCLVCMHKDATGQALVSNHC